MTQMRNRRHIAAKWNTILCKDVDAKINALVDKSTSWQARRTIYGKCSPHRILLLTYERVLVRVGNGIYWAPLVFMPMLSYLISCMVRMDTWTTSIIPQIMCNHMLMQSYVEPIIPFVHPTFDPHGNLLAYPEYQTQRGRPKR